MITTTLRWSAGFGSNFLQAIDWYWYSKNTNIPIYVNWYYNNINIFDNFFVQQHEKDPNSFVTDAMYISSKLVNNPMTELRHKEFPIYKRYDNMLFGKYDVYKDVDFKKLLIFFNNLLLSNVKIYPDIYLPNFENTLGVHARVIGLYYANMNYKTPLYTIMSEEEYYNRNLQQIKEKFETGRYDNIYLGCDDIKFFNICLKEFKDKIIYQDYIRTIYHNWENRKPNQGFNYQGLAERLPLTDEFYNAFIDIVALSKCKDFLGTVSSFTFSVLVFNPYFNFDLFNTTKGVITG